MLASKYRFHGYGALKFLFSHGKTYRSKSVSVRVAHNSRRQNSRVAVVVGKKVLKVAPRRNRVRRRVYEILRVQWAHIKPAQDILVSVYDPELYDVEHDKLKDEIIRLLKDAGVWVE